jgi:hypothetical protein
MFSLLTKLKTHVLKKQVTTPEVCIWPACPVQNTKDKARENKKSKEQRT